MASSLETNKALAALLTAGIIASGSGVISRIIYHPSMPEENAYHIEVPEGEAAGGEAAEPEATPLPVLLAAASPEAGEGEAKKCAACHSFEQGGAAKIGPPLWGVVGRDIASVEGFAYSDALLEKEGQWSFDSLSGFLTDPKGFAPGTKMAFAGVKDPEDRADVLVYLRSLAESPVPLPEAPTAEAAEAEPAAPSGESGAEAAPADAAEGEQEVAAVDAKGAADEAAGAAAEGDAIGARLAHADVDAGAKSARVCAACHSFEEGGAAKIGPPLWGVVGREIASLDDFSYSDALAGKEGEWSYQALDAYLSGPREWAPGTKMAFAGVRKPDDRANLILYLRSLSNEPAPLP
jgi:cytochrome c